METPLRSLLDKVYELEGLVTLAITRDASLPDLLRLIASKGDEVANLTSSLSVNKEGAEKSQPDAMPSDTGFTLEEYSLDDELAKEKFPPVPQIDSPSRIEETERSPRGKLVFSINERFRFRKELFDNSDADFNNTLALVASMENYEEAEDYFLNEEGFDSNKPVVKEFLEVVKKYFR